MAEVNEKTEDKVEEKKPVARSSFGTVLSDDIQTRMKMVAAKTKGSKLYELYEEACENFLKVKEAELNIVN